jgi:hypothetical protein
VAEVQVAVEEEQKAVLHKLLHFQELQTQEEAAVAVLTLEDHHKQVALEDLVQLY